MNQIDSIRFLSRARRQELRTLSIERKEKKKNVARPFGQLLYTKIRIGGETAIQVEGCWH